MASDPNADIKLNPVEARQGTRAPKLVYVLAASVVLVVVAFAIVWATQR